MANVNQVVLNNETLIDLASDTVTPSDLSEGVTAHNAAGNIIVGTAVRGLPVGFEYKQTNPNIQTGSLPLIGGVYDRTIYADLWAWVQTQGSYLITESEWQALAEANGGAVPFYSDGDGSTTFRVPALTVYVKGTSSIDAIGGYLAAGLPNIQGEIYGRPLNYASGGYGAIFGANGAFSYAAKSASVTATGITVSEAYACDTVTLEASRSDGIYGNSTTVQPESIVGIYCVVAFGHVVSSGEVDLDSVATLLAETQQAISNTYTICGEATDRADDAPTYGLA